MRQPAPVFPGSVNRLRVVPVVAMSVREHVPEEKVDAVTQYVLGLQEAGAAKQLAGFRSFGLAMAERGGRLPESFQPWAEGLARQFSVNGVLATAALNGSLL